MTDADYSNLIVACKTSTMRSNSASWRDVLDKLANRLGKLRDQLGTEGERHL